MTAPKRDKRGWGKLQDELVLILIASAISPDLPPDLLEAATTACVISA